MAFWTAFARQMKTVTPTKTSTLSSDGMSAVILVVDDDPLLRMSLALEIRDAGFHVREAANADEAERILSDEGAIGLVVTDIEMPGSRDGLAFAKSVRAFKPHIKLIVASGAVPGSGVDDIADAFFGKPYDTERMITRIASLLAGAPPYHY